jgi:diadenosine tetraphosphate (Ap4A) HIT family hydrolase
MSINSPDCAYCRRHVPDPPDAVWLDEHWSVVHGPAASTRPGGLQVVSRRHYVDPHEMDDEEAAGFGLLVRRLDGAVRAVTGAERVHLVSTRDRVPHFHAWLYPRHAADELRGTTFLAAPQQATPEEVATTSVALRAVLA